MTAKKDTTLAVLREIRDEIRATNSRLDATNSNLGSMNERLGHVELGLLDLAEQQRFVVRYLRAGSDRDHRFEQDLAALRSRVDALEAARPR